MTMCQLSQIRLQGGRRLERLERISLGKAICFEVFYVFIWCSFIYFWLKNSNDLRQFLFKLPRLTKFESIKYSFLIANRKKREDCLLLFLLLNLLSLLKKEKPRKRDLFWTKNATNIFTITIIFNVNRDNIYHLSAKTKKIWYEFFLSFKVTTGFTTWNPFLISYSLPISNFEGGKIFDLLNIFRFITKVEHTYLANTSV